jgi:GNAT superfamily N-acetyltransferase/chorismate mutase
VTPTDLTLRPAVAGDAADVARVHLTARRAAPMPPLAHTDAEVRSWLAGRITVDEVWVAEVGSGRRTEVAGYARLGSAWLDDLYVAPPHARAGIGSALLDLVKAQRPDGFCLWVFEQNAPARAFYARHGLVELERTDGSANEERAPDIRVAWPGGRPLAFLRGLVDEVDAELGDLLARRVALTRAIQPLKTDPARDPAREAAIAAAMARRVPDLGPERLARVVDAIVTESIDAVAGRPR